MAPVGDAPPFAYVFNVTCPQCGQVPGFKCQGVRAGIHDGRLARALELYRKG